MIKNNNKKLWKTPCRDFEFQRLKNLRYKP